MSRKRRAKDCAPGVVALPGFPRRQNFPDDRCFGVAIFPAEIQVSSPALAAKSWRSFGSPFGSRIVTLSSPQSLT